MNHGKSNQSRLSGNEGFCARWKFVPAWDGMSRDGTRNKGTKEQGILGTGENPVETPFMASEVREFVERVAFGVWK
jgi:hypothetical protein